MAKQYYTTITTTGPGDPPKLNQEHNEKLNNYLKYGYPGTTSEMGSIIGRQWEALSYEIEVKHQNTASTVRNNWYVITTVLCCEDEYNEEK